VIRGNLNLWQGWGIEPKEGDWSKMHWHMENILPCGDPAMSKYIFNWTAWGYQHPDKKREVALALRGLEGAGKGTFGHALRRSYGVHGTYLSQSTHLTGKFNFHFMATKFVFADEAFWAGDKQGEKVLMSLITDDLLMIEKKGDDAAQRRNYLDLLMATNDKWVVPAGPNARRYAVTDCDPRYAKGKASEPVRKAYFAALNEEMANGGIAAMMWDMSQVDLGDWTPHDIPQTLALIEQKQQSLRGLDRWYERALQTGRLPRQLIGSDGRPGWDGRPDCATTSAMCEATKEGDRGMNYTTEKELKDYLKKEMKINEDGGNTKWRVPKMGHAGCKFPPLEIARARFAEKFGGSWPWDEEVVQWGN